MPSMTSDIFYEIAQYILKKRLAKGRGMRNAHPLASKGLEVEHQRGHERILLPRGDGAAYKSLRCMGRRNERPKGRAGNGQRNTVYAA
jgi:hypothetical protein